MDKERVLYYLEELNNYKLSDNDKDVRGWKVNDVDSKVIGHVENLLVNKNSERVVYLDVEVDESIISANFEPHNFKTKKGIHHFLNHVSENHIIIPVGMVTLDLKNKIVSTKKINYDTFAHTKRLKKGEPINREYEVDVFDSYTKPGIEVEYPEDDTFYNRDEFGN